MQPKRVHDPRHAFVGWVSPQGAGRGCKVLKPQQHTLRDEAANPTYEIASPFVTALVKRLAHRRKQVFQHGTLTLVDLGHDLHAGNERQAPPFRL